MMKNIKDNYKLILISGLALLLIGFGFQISHFINGVIINGLPHESFPFPNYISLAFFICLFPLSMIFILAKKRIGWIITNILFIYAIAFSIGMLKSGIWFITNDAPENPIEWITILDLLYFIFDLIILPLVTLIIYGLLFRYLNKAKIKTEYNINRLFQIATIIFSITTIITFTLIINNGG